MTDYYDPIYDTSSSGSIKRMVAEDVTEEDTPPSSLSIVMVIMPRVIGVIATLSASIMLVMAWKRRKWLFHRLVLAMSIHIFAFGAFLIYGVAAVPSSQSNAIGNVGTVATCSAQGFVLYFSGLLQLFYYASFSVYSFVGVLSNFQKAKILWIEKYIHIFLPVYPLCSGIYFLSVGAFRYKEDIGICGITTNKNEEIIYHIPFVFVILFPTVVMAALVIMVKKRQAEVYIETKTVALQACIYLAVIYWTALPFLLDSIIDFYHVYGVVIYLNVAMFALWSLIVYLYFSVEKKSDTSIPSDSANNASSNENSAMNASANQETGSKSMDYIFDTPKIDDNAAVANKEGETLPPSPPTQTQKYSFNIFDGTNASGAFAQFIHEGDSDDEQMDEQRTKHWNAVQDHV